MIRRLVVLALVLSVLRCERAEHLPPLPPMYQAVDFSVADVSGCYSVTMTPWSPRLSREPIAGLESPRNVVLTLDLERFPQREPAPARPWSARYRLREVGNPRQYSSWSKAAPDKVRVTFSDGFSGFTGELTVDREARSLVGAVKTIGAEGPERTAEITLEKVPC
jgi:hypothetical protein